MFSLEQLLFAIANDQRSKEETVVKILPMLSEVYETEKCNRQALKVNNDWWRALQMREISCKFYYFRMLE